MGPSDIAAAVGSLKAARELLKLGIDAKADAQAKDRVIEVLDKLGKAQDSLYDLREELFRLQSENERLTLEAAERDRFEDRLRQYSLWQGERGAVVYKFNGEPNHYACPACVNQKRIEVLQKAANESHQCPSCKTWFRINPTTPFEPTAIVNPWKNYDPYKRSRDW